MGFDSRIIEGENMVMIDPYDIAGKNVIMVARNTRPPKNPAEHSINNIFTLDTLARRDPSRLLFFQPCMHYARQDKEFLGGESWSLKTIAKDETSITQIPSIGQKVEQIQMTAPEDL